jgi:hypothetical protein
MLDPGDRIGDWIVEAPLGEGGMGAVYRCHQPTVTTGIVWVGSPGSGALLAYEADTGASLLTTRVGIPGATQPVIYRDRLFIGFFNRIAVLGPAP